MGPPGLPESPGALSTKLLQVSVRTPQPDGAGGLCCDEMALAVGRGLTLI